MIAIVAITKEGKRIAGVLNSGFSGKSRVFFSSGAISLKGIVGNIFNKEEFEGIIFIMALGIVIRLIAPHLKDKYRDPAVVVIDEGARFAISALSGHEGGANTLAVRAGNILSAEPVITTGSEAKKKIVIGIGCRRNAKKDEIIKAIKYALGKIKYSLNSVRYIATIDLKKDEPGLKEAGLELGIPLRIISKDAVKNFTGYYHRSDFVKDKIGVEGVCEPCALLAAGNSKILLPKIKLGPVTAAIAKGA